MHYLRQPVNLGQDVDSIDVDQTCMRSRDGCLATVSMRLADVPGIERVHRGQSTAFATQR